MKTLRFLSGFLAVVALADGSGSTNATDKPTLLVVVGAPGEEEYGKNFEQWGRLWENTGREAGAKQIVVGLDTTNEVSDLARVQQALKEEPIESPNEMWLVLIGHGTFDGKEAKFNLRGPDLSAAELAAWLQPFRRPLAVINCASSSGPFINKLSTPGRVLVTATRSGFEQNYARFGQFLAEAIADPKADLDKDAQTSLLEAFLIASRRVAEFYDAEGRLATEHALLDDNGDGLGTQADWFRGIRAVKKARDGAALDGLRAHQFHLIRGGEEQKMPPAVRTKRDEFELSIARLREAKAQMSEEEYYRQLEPLLMELAKIYEQPGATR